MDTPYNRSSPVPTPRGQELHQLQQFLAQALTVVSGLVLDERRRFEHELVQKAVTEGTRDLWEDVQGEGEDHDAR
jgi:hypothetical protein